MPDTVESDLPPDPDSARGLDMTVEPGFSVTAVGDVAIVSAATTFTPMSRTMDPLGEAPGRPGLSAIRTAKRNADFVIVHVHAHEPGNWSETPPAVLEELAHRAVDVGADQFVGHGLHQLRGIEIYRGEPIFYGLANFIFQNEPTYPVAMDG